MRNNDIANWYKNKHRGQNVPQWELERKWRMYLHEEEQLRLAEAAANRNAAVAVFSSGGGGFSGPTTPPPYVPTDPDALAYVNVLDSLSGVSLTDVEKQSIDNLFTRMKGNDPLYSNYGNNGIWAATKALYPYVGSNIEAYRFNAVFPTAVTQAVDLINYPTSPGYQFIAGGITVDGVYGPKGNGINGVILTNLNWASGLASSLSPTNLSMGAVYKTTSASGRDDFGEYNPTAGYSGIWLRTKPSPIQSRMGCLESSVTGNVIVGGRGHWMLWRSGGDKRVYYQGNQATYAGGADRALEGQIYHGADTWVFLALNFNYFNNGGASAFPSIYATRCVNFSSNTLMLSYVMDGFSSTLIPAWNQIVEDFCTETGKKTW